MRLLVESRGHIMDEPRSGNDFGEDILLSFVNAGERTGDHIRVQVKSGTSSRSAVGYSVRVRQHGRDWLDTNVPVVCVVYDPKLRTLFWANATEQLGAEHQGRVRSIRVEETAVLDDLTVDSFAEQMIAFTRQSRASAGIGQIPALVSTVPDGGPLGGNEDLRFASIARWVETHGDIVRRLMFAGLVAIIGAAIAMMVPALFRFASDFTTTPPWIWVAVVIGYTVLGLGALVREARLGDSSWVLRLVVYVPLFAAYYTASANQLGVRIPQAAATVVAAVVPSLVHYAMLIGFVYYLAREMDRRRRLRGVGHNPDAVSDPQHGE